MKNISDIIGTILFNILCGSFVAVMFTPFWMILSLISSTIIENVFDIKVKGRDSYLFTVYIVVIVYSILLMNHETNKHESDRAFYKRNTLIMFVFILLVTYFFGEPIKEKASLENSSAYYHYRREYSPNYSYHDSHSNSSNRYSEPSDYTPTPTIEDKPLFPQKDNEEYNNQSSSKLSDIFSEPSDINSGSKLSDIFSEPSNINSDKISPTPSETAIYERWEYVTSDYQGNDYYINKNFGVNISITSFEGKVFYASFKKVLSNGGREVEVPVYDINRGEIMEKQILSYEESIIRFRNLNGVKEFSFYAMSGYTPDNFAIIGWGIDNIDGTYNWQPINDEVYDALYNAAYEKLE